jgi:8-oxo-dGTP pyrophosphatase MutT (NUDIX family)
MSGEGLSIMSVTPAAPRSAATLILLRDSERGLETMMIERHADLSFAPGALVFPGGCLSGDDHTDGDLPLRIAAIRECFEECGILLARGCASAAMIDAGRTAWLVRRYRRRLFDGELTFSEMLTSEGLVAACELLVPFGHWVTPEIRPKRFDTLFFLAPAPPGQFTEPDGSEVVRCLWDYPQDILQAANDGRARLIFATRMNLARLSRCASVAEALADASKQPVIRITPQYVETGSGAELRIPQGTGYGPCVVPASMTDLA